ncbi:hypothetical protein [Streptomyces mirabilis]|uniref:hypothetical protein n=1 Tax=Streptomyces mirabilis TaxID=68239 RepID=UPI0036766414
MRARLAALAAGALLAGLTQPVAWADPPAPTSSATKAATEARRDAVPSAERAAVLGKGWQASGDVAWTTSGDADGFHLLTARKGRIQLAHHRVAFRAGIRRRRLDRQHLRHRFG